LALITILQNDPQNENGATWEVKNLLETLSARTIRPSKVHPFKPSKVHPFRPQPSESLPKKCSKNHKNMILKYHISISKNTQNMLTVKNGIIIHTKHSIIAKFLRNKLLGFHIVDWLAFLNK
jgi:hypothetical protein